MQMGLAKEILFLNKRKLTLPSSKVCPEFACDAGLVSKSLKAELS